MTVLRFTVPGEPRGKGRPRFGRTRAGHAVAYTDSKTASYENLVKLAAKAAGARVIDGPVTLFATAFLAIPKSASKRRRADMLAGRELPLKRPDADNLVKALADGLNGVAFHDDAQIVDLYICKRWSDEPRLEVKVSPAILAGITEQSDGSERNKAA